jgi:phosphate butyryltransferase
MITNFSDLVSDVKMKENRVLAVAAAGDLDVLEAVQRAQKEAIASAILVGNKSIIEKIAIKNHIDLGKFEIVDEKDDSAAVDLAIKLIQHGKANVLMKGLCSTSILMKAVLDKEKGLRKNKLLSHFALFEIPTYSKLIMMSDAALNISPSLEEKIAITENAIYGAHQLGLMQPKVAILCAIEKVNPQKMPATIDAAIITKMSERGQIVGAIIDGPLAVDNAFSLKSCEIKKINSPVGGNTDIAIVPNIESGNIFYKTLTYLANSKTAGVVLGASVPIVLTSRADSDESKFLSIATAVRIASGEK